jgi:hypothetical protein
LLISRRDLQWTKQKAIRGRMWFKVLERIERAIVDLAIRCVDWVRSARLEAIIANIIEKLENAFVNDFDMLVERVGRPLAEKLSRIASAWGNVSALAWGSEKAFLRYLTVLHLNTLGVFRVGSVERKPYVVS